MVCLQGNVRKLLSKSTASDDVTASPLTVDSVPHEAVPQAPHSPQHAESRETPVRDVRVEQQLPEVEDRREQESSYREESYG